MSYFRLYIFLFLLVILLLSPNQALSDSPISRDVMKASQPGARFSYKWLASGVNSCDDLMGRFKARYSPFGEYSMMSDFQKQQYDGAVALICNNKVGEICNFELCHTEPGGPSLGDLENDYYRALSAQRKNRLSQLASAGKARRWKMFTLEESHKQVAEDDGVIRHKGRPEKQTASAKKSSSKLKYWESMEKNKRAQERFEKRLKKQKLKQMRKRSKS